MTEHMTEQQQQEFLAELGLGKKAKKAAQPPAANPEWHTMKVSDIEFDPALLDDYPTLDTVGKNAAQNHIFSLYKSPGRDKDRNSLLWSRIRQFINQVDLSRRSEGIVKPVTEKIKTTKEERELAKMLAGASITVEDLAALIKAKGDRA